MLEGSVRVVKVGQHLRLVNDMDPVPEEEFSTEPEYVEPDSYIRGTGFAGGTPPRDRLIKYCIIASLIAHAAAFVLLSRSAELYPAKPLLKPGEKVTQVRLIEPPPEAKKPEPPPEKFSAVTDRNHTAPKDKKPLAPPKPTAPLGRPVPPEKRIAALAPPMAPEDVLKPRKPQEEQKKEIDKKPPTRERLLTEPRSRTTPLREPQKKPTPKEPSLDLRPTPAEIARGLAPPSAGSPDFFPDGDAEEIVVDINTREFEFSSYLLGLKRKIEGVWVYPPVAAKNGIGGALTLEFSIARSGQLVDVNLLDSSGNPLLDGAALNAIKNAAPYIPFPERMRAKRLRIRANFIYVTNNVFRRIM